MSVRRKSSSHDSQLQLDWKTWGGARRGAGRKRTERPRVPHRRRERLSGREPIHITTKLVAGLPSMRTERVGWVVFEKLRAYRERDGFRVVHFSVQTDHIHMIVEADDRASLSRGMRALSIALARALNRLWQRSGSVFRRYHEQLLDTPRQVRNAIKYVLHNARKHHQRLRRDYVDPLSSAQWFSGWTQPIRYTDGPSPTSLPRTWLLRTGWLRRGPIPLTSAPA